LGGLSLSAVLTLLVVPPLMAVIVGPLERRRVAKIQTLATQSGTRRTRIPTPAE
jgi:hypothetical protein